VPNTVGVHTVLQQGPAEIPQLAQGLYSTDASKLPLNAARAVATGPRNMRLLAGQRETAAQLKTPTAVSDKQAAAAAALAGSSESATRQDKPQPQPAAVQAAPKATQFPGRLLFEGWGGLWECLLHVSTFATTRVALPTGVKPG
jgi:hypothetical protein